ncbi:prepilin-type N-terminal cleavage/methylation domain-containing protein [Chitinibacter bivalviorum]|uniref:Prepilin-type N-terminal cleavage/methylation domain-containing protein n=1 Tax=Chitinibacter bivalviorum TaxID=2739434 RepID=A0A7H9BFK1_9NEIS|nr:prepilin-type N-terminal cleavage/methylation domain-containing protein [Chitinibacter bivalviorum]QLG87016.1 prepilin-type N-terminal cleavage/methylation domain-containing protein [Chitinibacter bivalviorum]
MKNKQQGFTLVELAIVLVIIGLILGMAFKGKDLIDGAKVKNMQAQYNKIVAAFNIYYEKYGNYPGDGCTVATTPAEGGAATCSAPGTRNGLLNTADEVAASMRLLQNANILTNADIQSVFGQPWVMSNSADTVANFAANTNYITLTSTNTAAADIRFVCALDRLMDDGAPDKGIVRSGGVYSATADCWSLSGQVSMGIRVLP